VTELGADDDYIVSIHGDVLVFSGPRETSSPSACSQEWG
jgi:hypothetical protein